MIINLALIPFAEAGNVAVFWIFTISFGIAFGAPPMLLRSMMADLTDEDELTNGKKRPGLFFALLTTTDKVGAALGWVLVSQFWNWPSAFNPAAVIQQKRWMAYF